MRIELKIGSGSGLIHSGSTTLRAVILLFVRDSNTRTSLTSRTIFTYPKYLSFQIFSLVHPKYLSFQIFSLVLRIRIDLTWKISQMTVLYKKLSLHQSGSAVVCRQKYGVFFHCTGIECSTYYIPYRYLLYAEQPYFSTNKRRLYTNLTGKKSLASCIILFKCG